MRFWNLLKQEHKRIRNFFWVILAPLSFLWALGARLKRKIKKAQAFEKLFIIGVGNIHSGGSGKTPLVAELATRLAAFKPLILMRGYGFGDEAKMLHKRIDAPIYIAKKRLPAFEDIQTNALASLVIVDDGFQDATVKKSLELVLISDQKDVEDLFCLPLGELREPIDALERADAVLLVKNNNQNKWRPFLESHFSKTRLFEAQLKNEGLYSRQKNYSLPLGATLGAYSGIAGPQRFYETLQGTQPFTLLDTFEDHHVYTPQDLESLYQEAKKQSLTHLVTTEKDYWKCVDYFDAKDLPLLYLRIGYDIEKSFWDFLEQAMNAHSF